MRAAPVIQALTTDDIESALAAHAPVAVGVSGGKDSQAAALAVAAHLDRVGHCGPRILVHSSLGVVEWLDSLPTCERLAEHLEWELVVLRRPAGDLLHRWEARWESCVKRYRDLSCTKLILPWSTPSLRFCSGEFKTHLISSALRKRFPNGPIVSASGVRAEESLARSRRPIANHNARLSRKKPGAIGIDWNPILLATKADVLSSIAEQGLALHQAYTEYGTSRVSCRFCIMSSISDLNAAASADESHDLYRKMCDLELRSSFSFQSGRWLSTIQPKLLGAGGATRIAASMAVSHSRQQAERRIPTALRFSSKGWPQSIPTLEEAHILASVRCEVSRLYEWELPFATAASVRDRIAQLYETTKAIKP